MANHVDNSSSRLTNLKLDPSNCFNNYADTKLAGLILDNGFSIHLAGKLFDMIKDSKFRSDEVTLQNVWEVFDCVSTHRRTDAGKRILPPAPVTGQARSKSRRVTNSKLRDPPFLVAIDMSVDRLIQDRVPLGVAAMERSWKPAFKSNGADFHDLSLVHRSWTTIAQRGLRHRAVIPYKQIDKFLLSPLCGPWVTEMIIYWTVDCRRECVTADDFAYLRALFERTPNIHSLSFNTSLVSFSDQQGEPFLGAGTCIEIIASTLPNLKSLWLNHCYPPGGYNLYQGCYLTGVCNELDSLCRHISRMKALEFLSVRSWTGKRHQDHSLIWGEHPSPGLKTIDFDLSGEHFSRHIAWIAHPRGNFQPESLSILVREAAMRSRSMPLLEESLKRCLPKIKKLRLCVLNDWRFGFDPLKHKAFCNNILPSCTKLVSLDFFVLYETGFEFDALRLPRTLRRVAIHFYNEKTSSPSRLSLSSSTDVPLSFLKRLTPSAVSEITKLPRVRSLLVTGSPSQPTKDIAEDWDLDGFARYMNEGAEEVQEDDIPDALLHLCRKGGVNLICLENAFPRHWNIPRRD